MTETSVVYDSAVKQLAHNEDRFAKIRHGLRELKADAAAQSLHDENGNAARAAFAAFEGRIEQLLAIGAAVLLICLLATTAHAEPAAPDPSGAPNAVTLISGPNTYQEGTRWYTAFLYRVDVADIAAASPDCSADLALQLCSKSGTRVSGWPNWQRTSTGVSLTNLPRGTTQFSVVSPGIYSGGAISYTLTIDGVALPAASTWGAQCTPTAVYLTTLSAQHVGMFGLFR